MINNHKERLIIFFIFILFSLFYLPCFCEVKENKNKSGFVSDFKDALKELLTERVLGRIEADKHKKDIHKKVKKEVKNKLFKDSTTYLKNKEYGRKKPVVLQSLRDKFFVYKLPAWDFPSLPYLKAGILQIKLDFDYANRSYSSKGKKQDLSNLIFRQDDIYIRDILSVTRLLEDRTLGPITGENGVVDLTKNYLYILANQLVKFDASTNKQIFSINYARHVHHGDFSFGFQFPLVRCENELKLTSGLSATKRNNLTEAAIGDGAGVSFFASYDDLDSFLVDVLSKKGISFTRKDQEIGIGDPSLFLNFEFDWKYFERSLVGINFMFSLSQPRDTSKLWDPELGNGGFHKVEAFASFLASEDRFLNPHLQIKVSSAIPATVKRRVPKIILYDPDNNDPAPNTTSADDRFLFGDQAIYRDVNITSTNGVDSKVRRFSDTATKINLSPGPELFIKIGNIIERCFWRQGFLDFFYDIRLKGKDYVGFWLDSDSYNTNVLTDNTWQVEQRLGFSYSYQFDEHFRIGLSGIYSFAGRNVPRTAHFDAYLNLEF